MRTYMLKGERGWYKRGGGCYGYWVDQQFASIWTSKNGPNAAMGQLKRNGRPVFECRVIEFKLVEQRP